jgi:hypothetical protein
MVILIDFWYPVLPVRRIDNTVEFLNTNTAIKTVVLSTYNAHLELLTQSQNSPIWYRNRTEWYAKSSEWAKDRAILEDKLSINDTTTLDSKTEPGILQYYNPTQYQIAMFQYWEIEYYLSIHPEIKNIYVLGSAWDECVKYRPAGYLELSKLQNINILTDTNLVRTSQCTIPDLSLDSQWINVKGSVYRYLGNQKIDP